LDELAATFGTPLYAYQLQAIRGSIADLVAALPVGTRPFYSAKANPHPIVIGAVGRAGLGIEVSSSGELAAVLAAHQPAGRCLYTGPGKTADEVTHALRCGVELFSVESGADLDRLAAAAVAVGVTARYLVRLNLGGTASSGLRMTGRSAQFGIDTTTPAAVALLRRRDGVHPAGVHVFTATNVTDEAGLAAEFTAIARTVAQWCDRAKFRPEFVDLGGGFAAPYATPGTKPRYLTLAGTLTGLLDEVMPGWRSGAPAVAFESGRYLVAEAGTLLTTVLDVKQSRGTTYVVLDCGINALAGTSGTGRLLPPGVTPTPTTGPPGAAGPGSPPGRTALVGPLCTPLDVLNRETTLAGVRVGDRLEIPNVGAYGLTASLVAFLGRPLPVEVVLDGDEVVGARRLQLRAVEAGRPALP
jgi:diaminopimelate decarboxylase